MTDFNQKIAQLKKQALDQVNQIMNQTAKAISSLRKQQLQENPVNQEIQKAAEALLTALQKSGAECFESGTPMMMVLTDGSQKEALAKLAEMIPGLPVEGVQVVGAGDDADEEVPDAWPPEGYDPEAQW